MSTWKHLLSEIAYRPVGFALSLLAIAVAAGLFVAGPTLLEGYRRSSSAELKRLEDETRKTMLKLGFNLRIIHRDADRTAMRTEFTLPTMPEEYVERLAKAPQLTKVAHLVATLTERIKWEGRTRLLVGYAPEAEQANSPEKKPIGLMIDPGTVVLGHEAGIGHRKDETVEILGKPFRVAAILNERGSNDDIMLAVNLKDAQSLVNKPGQITEILAVNCRCETVDRVGEIREQLAKVLPDTKIEEWNSAAVARAEQRELVKRHHQADMAKLATLTGVVTPLVIAAAAIWVGLLIWSNVRQRRNEIGVLRALGKSSRHVAGLFLGKAAMLGLLGGLIGTGVGVLTAHLLAKNALMVEPASPTVPLVVAALVGAPLLAALAAYLPALSAITLDPAVALREE
jgi:putative ABC transport system permease protein